MKTLARLEYLFTRGEKMHVNFFDNILFFFCAELEYNKTSFLKWLGILWCESQGLFAVVSLLQMVHSHLGCNNTTVSIAFFDKEMVLDLQEERDHNL